MKYPRVLLLAFGIQLLGYNCFADRAYESVADGKAFTTVVADQAVAKTPAWQPSEDNPPLSGREALKLATRMKDKLVRDEHGFRWELESLSIIAPPSSKKVQGKFYWLTKYVNVPHEAGAALGGIQEEILIVVLMDGTVLRPDVREAKLDLGAYQGTGSGRDGGQPRKGRN